MPAGSARDTLLQSTKNVLSETTILFRSSHQRCSIKRLFIKISQYSQEKTYVPWSLFLTKWQDWIPATLFKIDTNTGFPCEYCKILKSTKFENTLHAAQFMKRNHWNVPLCIFMFSCTNVYYRHAQSNSYWVLNFK